jgi:hypothetical protein
MHLVIPFAAPLAETGRAALATLELPRLRALLAGSPPGLRDEGDEFSLSAPHERALARALGIAGADGALPWAARQARLDGIDTGDLAWGLVTPVHLHVGTEQVSLIDPGALMLGEDESREVFEAVRELFTSEGFVMLWAAPLRWYVAHESLADLATASLDRVIGRNVDRWLPGAREARLVRRLQNEVQMLLYTHPLNAAREARGLLPVNSFWLSGCGVAQPDAAGAVRVDDRLRGPALGEDWAGWARAWETLDEGPLAELQDQLRAGESVLLTLCGERSSETFTPAGGLLARIGALWRRPAVAPRLETL